MWILPSLNRPKRAYEVAERAPEVPILMRLHHGDSRLEEYLELEWPEEWSVIVGPKMNLCDTLNWAYERHPEESWYGFLADDTLPHPKGWNRILEEEASDSYIAYPDDGIHGKDLCPHHCISGELIRALGWWCLPGLHHNFLDAVWYVLGQNLDILRYVPEVMFEHKHPIVQKAETDSTYRYGQHFFKYDQGTFERWLVEGKEQDLEKLRVVI